MKILLVRLRLIGDAVFTTPLVRAVRRRFPDAHVAYVVEPAAAPVIRGNPDVDDLIIAPPSRGLSRLRDDLHLARHLRRQAYDVAIDLHGGPRAGCLTLASGAPMRIGYTIRGRSWIYTHVVQRAPGLRPRHSVVNQWDLLTPLGIGPCDPARDPVTMAADADAEARITRRLDDASIGPAHPLIVLHVSAGNPFRRWPLDSFAALVAELAHRAPARRFVLTSGPSEWDAARRAGEMAAALIGRTDTVHCWNLDVPELRALIARAAVYIGGDSGPLHIAATTSTPVVALFGPTLPERSMPWRDPRWFAEAVDAGALPCRPCHQRSCEPGDFRCLTGIAPGDVVAAAERALASRESNEAMRA